MTYVTHHDKTKIFVCNIVQYFPRQNVTCMFVLLLFIQFIKITG